MIDTVTRIRRSTGILFVLLAFTAPAVTLASPSSGGKTSAASAGDDTQLRDRIRAMVTAMGDRNYGGRFVHVRGDEVELMRVVHRGERAGRAELLVAENGEIREIRRLGDRCACIWPERNRVMLGDHPKISSRLAGERFSNIISAGDHYRVVSLGESRVAGQSCDLMAVVPADDYRYGYKVCIGQAVPLLLRMSIYDERGRPIEHNQFTEIEALDTVSLSFEDDLVAGVDENFETVELGGEPAESAPIEQENWTVEPLPPGYHVRSRSWRHNPVTGHYFEHLVVTDGLATASVFVEKGEAQASRQSGRTRLGMRMATRTVGEMRITAIGDVPSATVESLVANTRRGPEEGDLSAEQVTGPDR
ncbi:MAG: MucB/RseB C-terminal domain-containing protein [Pseudomonadota bacterium]